MVSIPVYFVGLGRVGREVVRILLESASAHCNMYGVQFRIEGVFDSKGSIWQCPNLEECISHEDALSILNWKEKKLALKDHKNGTMIGLCKLKACIQRGAIVVDTSATDQTIPLLLRAAEVGCGIVLANKIPVSSSWEVFQMLSSSMIGMESTVGAGTPIIACLDRLLAGGDQIQTIEGAFSGTLGYLMTEIQHGTPFSDAVKEAYRLGYTEPDPREDLSGTDVARKALILARKCGASNLELEDIKAEKLFDESLKDISVNAFFQALSEDKGIVDQKLADAKANGVALRYVARIEFNYQKFQEKLYTTAIIRVGLETFDMRHPLGQLLGNDNLAAFTTKLYNPLPLIIRGMGAGSEVTARGVIADMVRISSKSLQGEGVENTT